MYKSQGYRKIMIWHPCDNLSKWSIWPIWGQKRYIRTHPYPKSIQNWPKSSKMMKKSSILDLFWIGFGIEHTKVSFSIADIPKSTKMWWFWSILGSIWDLNSIPIHYRFFQKSSEIINFGRFWMIWTILGTPDRSKIGSAYYTILYNHIFYMTVVYCIYALYHVNLAGPLYNIIL